MNAGRVEKEDLIGFVRVVEYSGDAVPRGLRAMRNNDVLAAQERVEQSTLADIGAAPQNAKSRFHIFDFTAKDAKDAKIL